MLPQADSAKNERSADLMGGGVGGFGVASLDMMRVLPKSMGDSCSPAMPSSAIMPALGVEERRPSTELRRRGVLLGSLPRPVPLRPPRPLPRPPACMH